MAYDTRSKAKAETVSQFPVVLDQHCSTSESVSHVDEITRKLREVNLSNITKKGKELNELPPKVSPLTGKLKRTGKEGEELQTNTERERDGERRGELKKVKVEHDESEASCTPKEEHSDGNLKELSAEKEQPTRQKVMELQGTLDNWEDTIERYKKFIAVTSFTLALIDDRSLSSCIADIRKANDAIKEEMERKFAYLESPASTKVNKEQEAKTAQDVKKVKITNPKMDIVGFATLLESDEYQITSITGLSVGKMVISGAAPNRQSHITVINSKGEIQDKIKMEGRSAIRLGTHRYCCNLSEEKVLTVYGTEKVAIYDVHKRVPCTSSSGSGGKCMSCVAYDPNEPKYIVCYGKAMTFDIFDYELKYSRKVKLPKKGFGFVNDIAVHGSFLLVCHQAGAHAVTMDGELSKIEFELQKPTEQYKAIGVCIDNYSFIYMLWSDKNFETTLCQYSKDGRELLLKMPLGKLKNGCLTTLDVDGTERLVIASNEPGILHSWQLIPEE